MSDPVPLIYIVDDDPAIRDSVAFLVSSVGYGFVACSSAQDFLDRVEQDRPGCLVLDIRLPGMSGLELQRELVRRGLPLGVIFITGHGDIPMAVRAMQYGAIDFLEKPFDDQVLLDQIDKALRHAQEERRQNTRKAEINRKLACLTEREREVMDRVVRGKTSKAIALDLDISVKTVENHRHNLMSKAGVTSVAQLIAWASES